jgi:uncharacterized membrane protein HdeD (DUF308 family)
MIRTLINNWWLLALRGFFALVFALLVLSMQPLAGFSFTRPIAHAALVIIFGLLALGAGISTILAAVHHAGDDRSHLLLWDGIAVGVGGLFVVLAPKLDLTLFVYFAVVWSIVIGILELLMARTLRRHIPDEWFLSLAGLASLALGGYLFFERSDASASLLRWLGVYAGFSAVTILALAFRLHSLRSSIHHLAGRTEVPAPK